MAYATEEELEAYLGTTPPANASTMLDRASDLIDYVTMGRIDATDTTQATVARKATCQQVEYWILAGDEYEQRYRSVSIGSFQATYDSEGSGVNKAVLAPRAKRTLFLAGMLYRGVRMI